MGERRLPVVAADTVLVSPHAARLLLATWDSAVVPALRRSGERVPEELAAVIDGCRLVVAKRQASVDGRLLDDGADTGPGSAHAETTAQAAARLEISERQVRRRLDQGRLPGDKIGRVWVVYAPDEGDSAGRAAAG